MIASLDCALSYGNVYFRLPLKSGEKLMTILSVSPVSAAAQPFARGRAWIKPLLGAILALAMSLGIGVGLTDLLWPARLVLITFG